MITDNETNFVYFSDLLPQEHPFIFEEIIGKLEKNKIAYGLLSDTKDIWCRDYMPIQTDKNSFVSFKYKPSYLESENDKRSIKRNVGQVAGGKRSFCRPRNRRRKDRVRIRFR